MDDDGGMRNWGSFYENPLKGNLGLQLMPSVNDRETKPYFFFSNGTGAFNPEPSVPTMGFMRDSWMYHHRDTNPAPNPNNPPTNPNPNHHNPNPNLHHQHHHSTHHHQHHHQQQTLNKMPQYYEPLQEPAMATNLQMLNPDERVPVSVPVPVPVQEPPSNNEESETPKKKKKKKKQLEPTDKPAQQPKPKKAKKEPSSSDGKKEKANKDGETERIIINGLEIDLSKIPTPVCSCTGGPQQCYRWGIGGWQSACCTNTISVYPLPLSDKRRGARIAGRKMSIGAFRKVLERVVAEGVDLSEPIDLKNFWAKHGTNKFVTIR